MSREKMIPKAPATDKPEPAPFDKMAALTRHIIRVPKSEVAKSKKRRKRET